MENTIENAKNWVEENESKYPNVFQSWVESLNPDEEFNFKVTSEEMTKRKFKKLPKFNYV